MARSGHGYDPLLHYQPQSPFANQPYPFHNVSSHSVSTRPAMASGDAAKDPYQHHRNVIPGLGLGFASNVFDWHKQQSGTMQSQSHDTIVNPLVPGDNAPAEARFLNLLRAGQERVTPDDQVEDGEVSEGDMADSYEPAELRDTVVTYRHSQDKNGNVFATHVHGAEKFNRASSITHSTARDRSGSYSPYLSPHEIDRQEIAEISTGTFGHAARPRESFPRTRLPLEITQAHSQGSKLLPVQAVTEARKQAQDAILRLWPLNVRYQNYLDEGVDEDLLKSLFKDLGFDIGPKTATTASKLGNVNSGTLADVSIKAKEEHATPGKAPGTETALGKTQQQDKSEERKDRIARLLAAKNSKPSAPAPRISQPPEPTIHSPQRAQVSQPSPPPLPSTELDSTTTKHTTQPLSQSEKSKLLHQKMEALRKAREARGQKRPHPEEPELAVETPSSALASDVTPASSTTASADGTAQVKDGVESPIPQNERADASPILNEQPSQPIPGLFLSSTPQPCSTLKAAPGRHSAPVTTELDERPFKRPFGQMRGPRPFLIDVSDDEDDAEMEIDSPEHNSSTTYRPGSPTIKAMSTKTALSFGENGLVRQYSSPIRTPTGMNGDGCTREDLESMHKKIEAMKQKILEAEARKKAKSSRPESGASTPSNSFALGNSSESMESIAHNPLPPPLSPAVTVPAMSPSPPQLVSESSPQPRTQELQHVASIHNLPVRRSLSRNASERLPLLEARRREQQLRLTLLQSQMAGIEKEIQESLQEEQRLKDDVESAGPLQEEEEEKQAPVLVSVESPALLDSPKMASQKAPSPVEAVEAMDTTSLSSAASDEARQSRLSTPGLAQEAPVNHEMSFSAPTNLEAAAKVELASISKSPVDVTNSTAATKDNVDTASETKVAMAPVEAEDVGMEGVSSHGDMEDASDSYEPPEADSSSPTSDPSRVSPPLNTIPTEQHIEPPDENQPATSGSSPQSQQISAAQDDAAPEKRREVEASKETVVPDEARTGFEDYTTPLQQFHAYRFHPEFNKSIAGGLRSLTYSNKVDVKRELCPDDLAGRPCPRGKQCEFQHFETMQAPDDQILLQLGALGSFDEKKKQDYTTGLRQLLIDFRNNKIKDFQAISQGIIDYRARFLGDQSKILPLGNVTI